MSLLRSVLSSPVSNPTLSPLGENTVEIITATVSPILAALTDAQTPVDSFTSGTYDSTAGTIASETPVYYVNGAQELGTFDLSGYDIVQVREDVVDSEGNTKSFWTSEQIVKPLIVTITSAAPTTITLTSYSASVGIGELTIISASPTAITMTAYPAVVVRGPVPRTVTSAAPAAITLTKYPATVTVPDETAPVVTPSLDAESDTLTLIIAEENLPITIDWQVRAIGDAAPDKATVLAGTGGVIAGAYTIESLPDSEDLTASFVGGLTDSVQYTLYGVASDPSGNTSDVFDVDITYSTPAVVTVTSQVPGAITLTAYPATVQVTERNIESAAPNAITLTPHAAHVFIGDTWQFSGSVVTNIPTAPAWVFTGSVVDQIPDAA